MEGFAQIDDLTIRGSVGFSCPFVCRRHPPDAVNYSRLFITGKVAPVGSCKHLRPGDPFGADRVVEAEDTF